MKKGLTRLVCTALTAAMVISCLPAMPGVNFEMPFISEAAAADSITVYECQGAQETAYIEWAAVSDTDHYYVSYSKDGTVYTDIDDALIRQYPDRWRADLVGLAAGDYTVKVTAKDVNGGILAEQTAQCSVVAHDRTGFAFAPTSPYYNLGGIGAYKNDGTLKDNANVIYVTEDNFDEVTLTLNNKGGNAETVTGVAAICQTMGAAANKDVSNPPLAIRFIGTFSGNHTDVEAGLLELKVDKGDKPVNITFEGIGQDTIFNVLAFKMVGASNCEIRNIAFSEFTDDAIGYQGKPNSNNWIHNCDFFYGVEGSGDKVKGDGATDIKDDSKYMTISYNHYWDNGKLGLCGMKGESGENFISYHHNWFDHSDSRHPRVRTMSVHVFNNYFDGNSKYGPGASLNSSIFVEGNYFRNTKYPMLQGSMGHDSDGKGGSNTFDDSTPSGKIKAFNNYMTGANLKFTADSKDVVNGTYGGDAYVVSERNEQVPSSYNIAGTTYNNFDTNGEVASYIQSLNIDTPQEAKTKVENYAGRVGEHFKYTFTEADDTDYSRSAILDEVFKSYVADTSDDFVSLGGASDGSGPVTIPSTSTESTTETTTSETKTDVITSETTTETTTSSLVPLAANTYDAAVISADTASFSIVDNQGKNGQIKINESGSVSFAVNAGANVTINYKCGSSDAAKSSAVSCAGRSGAVLSGGSEPAVLELANLSAGEYIITATQSGGTTAQLISIVVSYSQDEDGLWGDADGSGTLTANDSAVIILYTLDPLKAGLSDKTIKYCDVDASGSLGSNDAALVLQKTLTQEFTFPVEQN